jgi:hypothetical protein
MVALALDEAGFYPLQPSHFEQQDRTFIVFRDQCTKSNCRSFIETTDSPRYNSPCGYQMFEGLSKEFPR